MFFYCKVTLFDYRLFGKPDGSCERVVGSDVGDCGTTDTQSPKQPSNKTEPPGNLNYIKV